MNKGIAIKAGIILGFFILVLGLAYGCSSIRGNEVTPEISNREDVYLSVGDIEITNQQLWDKMRITDGLTYLEQYIEANIFLPTEIAAVTDEEVAERIEFYRYGTNDPDNIAEIEADEDLNKLLEDQFINSLVVLGYDPEDPADQRAFVELEVAKENVARQYIMDAEGEDNNLAVNDDDLQDYYEDNTKGEVCALPVIFHSSAEANALLETDEFKLVLNQNASIVRYTGTEDMSGLSTSDYDEDNTEELTAEEVFDEFVKLYNYMNPNEDDLTDSLANFCANNSDFVYDYAEMTEDRASNDPYVTFANYIFDTLDAEEGVRYSYTLQTLGEFKALVFKVENADVPAYDTLTDTEKADLKVELLDARFANASTKATLLNSVMATYWEDAEYEIFDPMLKLRNVFNGGEDYSNGGSETLVATIDGTDITADMLFEYMNEYIGSFYAIELLKLEMILASDEYTETYGDSYDYLDSDNDNMSAHREELRNMKGTFSSDGYAQFGFSSSVYTWEEFIVLAFNSETEATVIRDLFVVGELQPYLVRDSIAYENALDVIQDQIDEYFSLDIEHILIYVDMDKDLSPDEFNDYVDGLTGEDETEFNTLKAQLEHDIVLAIGADKSFDDIVAEYNDGLLEDPENDWARYKEYGFKLLTEDLSAQNSLNPTTTVNFDKDFVAGAKALYDEYVALIDASATPVTELYDDELVQSNFGLHFMYAEEGDAFEIPSAIYDGDDDTNDQYPTEAEGTTIIPNADQAALYISIKFAQEVGDADPAALPSNVYDALETYYLPTYNAYFTTSGYSIATVNYIFDNNGTFTTDNAEQLELLGNILDVLYNSTFPEGFNVPE